VSSTGRKSIFQPENTPDEPVIFMLEGEDGNINNCQYHRNRHCSFVILFIAKKGQKTTRFLYGG
jgi:hypothetical protein